MNKAGQGASNFWAIFRFEIGYFRVVLLKVTKSENRQMVMKMPIGDFELGTVFFFTIREWGLKPHSPNIKTLIPNS